MAKLPRMTTVLTRMAMPPAVGVIQAENNVNMADATQDDFTIVSCTRRTDAQAGGAAPSTAAMPADNESLAGSEVPLASRTGLLTVEALQAIQELALVPSRAGSARGPPSDASGSITLRRRGRHSRSPALSTSSRSHRGFNPTTERLGQIYEYLVAKVMQDESQDSAKCNAIAEKRNQKESELEAARLRILVEKERYKAQYDVATQGARSEARHDAPAACAVQGPSRLFALLGQDRCGLARG